MERSQVSCWPKSAVKTVQLNHLAKAAHLHISDPDQLQEFAWRKGLTACLLTPQDSKIFSLQFSASRLHKYTVLLSISSPVMKNELIFMDCAKSLLLCFSFLTILQSAEAQEAVIHPQMQKWMKTDRANAFEVSSPFVGGLFNPVTNMCEQVWWKKNQHFLGAIGKNSLFNNF